MSLVEWKESDCLGHPQIDAQHEALAMTLNSLHDLILAGADAARFDRALEEMLGLLRDHFSTEATLMVSVDYPKIGLHLDEHRTYLERIEGLRRAAVHAEASAIAETFFLLRDWFMAHTRKDDRALTDFVAARGQGLGGEQSAP